MVRGSSAVSVAPLDTPAMHARLEGQHMHKIPNIADPPPKIHAPDGLDDGPQEQGDGAGGRVDVRGVGASGRRGECFWCLCASLTQLAPRLRCAAGWIGQRTRPMHAHISTEGQRSTHLAAGCARCAPWPSLACVGRRQNGACSARRKLAGEDESRNSRRPDPTFAAMHHAHTRPSTARSFDPQYDQQDRPWA